jgi:hypothetical protein
VVVNDSIASFTVNYTDFKGFGYDDNLGTFSFKPNRSEAPFSPFRQL